MRTPSKKSEAAAALADTYDFVEIMALAAKINFLVRRFEKRHRPRLKVNPTVPDYGLVKIINPPEEFEEVTGEDGIVLGGGKVAGNGHTYTVLIPSRDETYYLHGSALQFTGVVLSEEEIYSGDSIRVAVDEVTGEGRIVKTSSHGNDTHVPAR